MQSVSNFCSDVFWDSNLTWNTQVPDFTECFQKTILIFVPCLCFLFAAGIQIYATFKTSKRCPLPWTILIILKIAFSLSLLGLSTIEMVLAVYQRYVGMNIPDIDIYSGCSKVITYILVTFVLIQNKATGVKSSTLLTVFWFLSVLFGTVIYRSTLLKVFSEEHFIIGYFRYVLNMVYFPLLACQFIFSLFPESTGSKVPEDIDPFDSQIFSYVTFHWVNRMIMKGMKKILTVSDFPPLSRRLRADYVAERFSSMWTWNSRRKTTNASDEVTKEESVSFKLIVVFMKAFWPWLLWGSINQLLGVFLLFMSPLVLDQIIKFISSSDYLWKGYLFCIALFLVDFITRQTENLTLFYSHCFASQLKSAFISSVYKKSMVLSSSSRRSYTSGEIVNLMSVDAQKVYEFFSYAPLVFGSPLRILFTILVLWFYLGPSCLAGAAVLLLVLVLSVFVTKKTNSVQVEQMETKDSRLKVISEILNGIKVLKFYAWEIPFMKRVADIRKEEVKLIRNFQFCYCTSVFVWSCAPFMIAVACFLTYTLVDERNILDPSTAFVSLSLLNIMRYCVMEIPELSSHYVQMIVSLKRLSAFLTAEEQDDKLVGNTPDSGDAVSVRNAIFSWEPSGDPTLRNINLHIPKGKFVAIIGPVGSGKSSLLSAILGEMYKSSGSVDVEGSFAYVPQQAWILNRTVKQNILFVNSMRKQRYDSVLESCCLIPDLEILPGGDNTEIGEKGVNLSGGQKQRVSLARAIYHNADIYLLDDPLSAVDAHVGKHIFEKVIGKNGLLRKKTRILVTHNISVLPEADCIFTMNNGKIEEIGTYDELMAHGGLFSELMQEHANVQNSDTPVRTDLDEPHATPERSVSRVSQKMRSTSVDSTRSKAGAQLIEEEKMEIGEVKRTAVLKYLRSMSIPFLSFFLVGYILNQSLEMGGNVWLSKWSSDPVLPDGTQDAALRNLRISVYSAFGICEGIAIVFGAVFLAIGAARASKFFHKQMLVSVMKAPMSFFDTTPIGRIINRFGSDIDDIDMEYPMELEGFVTCIVSATGTFAIIGTSTPLFLALLIPIGCIYYYFQKLYLMTSRQLKRLCSTTRSPIYSHLNEIIHGSSSIKAYKVSNQFLKEADEKLDTNILLLFYVNASSRWLEFRLTLIGDIIVLITSVLALESSGLSEASVAALSITYAISVNDIMNWLVRNGTELENKSVSIERVEEYSNLPSEAPWIVSQSYPSPSWPEHGEIEFKCYATRYRDDLDLALKNVNIAIRAGEKVGVVGRTGAGKSSFTLALFRIIEPVTGTVMVDDVDVSQIGLHQLRSKLTIIPQDPVLFTGSLRTNLDPNDEYPDSDLWFSLEHANMKNFVSDLPDGLNYHVAEGGGNLSVGQRQLICLSRALLKKTKVLVLDEATAAVDVETDSLIQSTIRTEFRDNTVITIAHRLNTIMDYDRVFVMDAGEIVEVGKPAELLQNPESKFYNTAKYAGIL